MTTQHQMVFPKDLKYGKEHTWVRINGDRATIGITDFAQSWVGNLLSIDLLEEDSEIEQGGLFGTLETSKVSFELYSPLSGTIIERNSNLLDQITLVNREPYEGGWMIVLGMRTAQDPGDLMDADGYREYIKNWSPEEDSDQ